MKISKLPAALVSAVIALVLFSMSVAAQEMDHSKMQMPMPAKDAEPAKKSATPKPMDHSQMDMPATPQPMKDMDHSKMGHDQAAEVDAMEGMDHSQHSMETEPAQEGGMEGMDHSNMGEMKGIEPPRLSRRLQLLRGWSNDQTDEVFPGSAGAGGSDGANASA